MASASSLLSSSSPLPLASQSFMDDLLILCFISLVLGICCALSREWYGMYSVEAYVQFCSRWRAIRARAALDGRALFEGCCFVAVKVVPPLYTSITTPDEMSQANFYNDTPYAEWAAALAVVERHDDESTTSATIAPTPDESSTIPAMCAIDGPPSSAVPRATTSAACTRTAMHEGDDDLTTATPITCSTQCRSRDAVMVSMITPVAASAASTVAITIVPEPAARMISGTGHNIDVVNLTNITEGEDPGAVGLALRSERTSGNMPPEGLPTLPREPLHALELTTPVLTNCSTDCSDTGTAPMLHTFWSDTPLSSTFIPINRQFGSKAGASAEDIATYRLPNDEVKRQVPRPWPWPSLECNPHSYGKFMGGMGAVQDQLQGDATAMVILQFGRRIVGIPIDMILQRKVLALHPSASGTTTNIFGTGCYMFVHSQKVQTYHTVLITISPETNLQNMQLSGQFSSAIILMPEDAIYYGPDSVQWEIAWLLVFSPGAHSLGIERKSWPPPPSIHVSVPAREQNAWFHSWLQLLLFENDCSLEGWLCCHTTGTCWMNKHMGLTFQNDTSYGADNLEVMSYVSTHGCQLIHDFHHEKLWDPGGLCSCPWNCQGRMVLVNYNCRLGAVLSTEQRSPLKAARIIAQEVAGDIRMTDTHANEAEHGITIKSTGITAALHITDDPLVVVDCIEGVCVQTETVPRQTLGQKTRPGLTINKMDMCFPGLQVQGEEAYQTFSCVIENANVIMATYEDVLVGDVQVYLEKGTVAFSVLFCYKPINQIIEICMNDQKDKLWPMLKKLGITMKNDDLSVVSVLLDCEDLKLLCDPGGRKFFGFFTQAEAKGRKNVAASAYYCGHCLDHAYFFDKVCADQDYYLDNFGDQMQNDHTFYIGVLLEQVRNICYLNLDKVCCNYSTNRDLGDVLKHQVPWDPGGSTKHRLEGKPKIKEGGMLAPLVPADGSPLLGRGPLGNQTRTRHIYEQNIYGWTWLGSDGFGLLASVFLLSSSSSISILHG